MPRRILVLEDEDSLRMLMQDILQMEGFDVIAAATGKEALELAWKKGPDLAIVDIGLPDMSGWEVCRRLKEDFRTSSIRILVISAQVGSTDTPLMKQLGVNHFVRKPYDPEKIVPLINALLEMGAKGSSGRPDMGVALG